MDRWESKQKQFAYSQVREMEEEEDTGVIIEHSPRISVLKEDALGEIHTSEAESSPLTPHRKVPDFTSGSFDEEMDGLEPKVVAGIRSQSEINLMNSDNENDPAPQASIASSFQSQDEKVAISQSKPLLFVPHKAVTFGMGSSSSDTFLLEESSDHYVEDEDKSPKELLLPGSETKSKQPLTLTLDTKSGSDSGDRKGGEAMMPTFPSDFVQKGGDKLLQQNHSVESNGTPGSEESPLISQQSKLGIKLQIKSQTAKFSGKDIEKHPILMASPSKSEDSSEDDSSTFPNTSEDADAILTASVKSDDGESQAVCSKYCQLSEDGSFPSSPMKSSTTNGLESAPSKQDTAPGGTGLENGLTGSHAFSDLVDLEGYKESFSKKSHTASNHEIKTEEQILTMLKSGSTKGMKSFLRKSQYSAHSEGRKRMWFNVCKQLLKAGGTMYEAVKSETTEGLPSIVDPSYVYNYHLNESGVASAHSVLNVLHNLHPDVTYCPLLYPLSALLLHYMTPADCCDCMQAMLQSKKPLFMTQTKMAGLATKYVLADLAKKYSKKAYDLISSKVIGVETVMEHWMTWIFHDLPFQCLVCIMDSFLLEGYKVLYRMVLAVLQLFTKDLVRKNNRSSPVSGDISASISRFCQSFPHEPRKLLKEAFGIKRLTRKEINKLQIMYENFLKVQASGDENTPAADANQEDGQTTFTRTVTLGNSILADPDTVTVLTAEMLNQVWSWVPDRMTLKKLKQVFTTEEHGFHLRTLYTRAEMYEPTLMVIRTTKDEIFGAYCATAWYARHKMNIPKMSYFGRGETFVFTLKPKVKVYPWVAVVSGDQKSADLFQAGNEEVLFVGSGNGDAICLDAELNRCHSLHCDTFNNEPLCSTEDFSCKSVEVFGFVD